MELIRRYTYEKWGDIMARNKKQRGKRMREKGAKKGILGENQN